MNSPPRPFVSYAQNQEDVMLWRALKGVDCGMYVDVGACDPFFDSVTQAFYERGWRGINIEPMPDRIAGFYEYRPQDVNLQIAIAGSRSVCGMYAIDGQGGLSTLREDLAGKYRSEGRRVDVLGVETRSLREVFAEHAAGEIHFLKIDVEGFEAEVLQGAGFDEYRPWIIVAEATLPTTQQDTSAAWRDSVLQRGYRLAYNDGINLFLIRNDKASELEPAFRFPPGFFDNFVPFREKQLSDRIAELTHPHDAEFGRSTSAGGSESREARLGELLQENFELRRRVGEQDVLLAELESRLRSAADTRDVRRGPSQLSAQLKRFPGAVQREAARFVRRIRRKFVNG